MGFSLLNLKSQLYIGREKVTSGIENVISVLSYDMQRIYISVKTIKRLTQGRRQSATQPSLASSRNAPSQRCVMTLKASVYQTPQRFPNKCPGAYSRKYCTFTQRQKRNGLNLKPGEYLSIIMSLASLSLLWLSTGRAFGLVPKRSQVRLLLGAPGVNLIKLLHV